MKIYVYKIYFPSSERLNPHYVGVTNNLDRRLVIQHLNSNNSYVDRALQKYDDWIVKRLHTCRTYEEAFRIEIEEIRNYNCVAPNGYNLTRGGEGTVLFGELNGMYGKHHLKETKEKMKKSHLGLKNPAVSESNKKRKGIKNPAVSESNKKRKGRKAHFNCHSINQKIKCLKTRIKNTEKEI